MCRLTCCQPPERSPVCYLSWFVCNNLTWTQHRCDCGLNLTLYPEDLMCTPLFVSVDFIRMKKDRSRELSGARRLGLLDSTERKTTTTHKNMQTWKKFFHRWIQKLRGLHKVPIKSKSKERKTNSVWNKLNDFNWCKTNKYSHSVNRTSQPIKATVKLSIIPKRLGAIKQ